MLVGSSPVRDQIQSAPRGPVGKWTHCVYIRYAEHTFYIGKTALNEASSRSHCCFQVKVERLDAADENAQPVSKQRQPMSFHVKPKPKAQAQGRRPQADPEAQGPTQDRTQGRRPNPRPNPRPNRRPKPDAQPKAQAQRGRVWQRCGPTRGRGGNEVLHPDVQATWEWYGPPLTTKLVVFCFWGLKA